MDFDLTLVPFAVSVFPMSANLQKLIDRYPGANPMVLTEAYNLGCSDTKDALFQMLDKRPIPAVTRKPEKAEIDNSDLVGSVILRRIPLADRKRAPRGLAKIMVDRALALSSTGKKGITSAGVVAMAQDAAEKMVSVSAIKNEFRAARDDDRAELRDGRWWPK